MYEDKIIKKAESIKNELINIRRDIHAHPELGFEEVRTSNLIANILTELGIEVRRNVAKTGVVGTLRGKKPGKTFMIRADMDCLKIDEQNDVPYKSINSGLMHACGHDAHTTCMLGAAMILSELKDEICGNVKFVFQPAEEINGGAEVMVKEGVLENPKVDAVLGMHIWPTIDAGKIGVRYGALCAAPDFFKITIHGKGGHVANPHLCVDPIAIACQVYMGLQTIVSRRVDPTEPSVISIGKFNAGTSLNIIPDYVVMEGSVRTLNNELRDEMPKMMESIIKGITEGHGGEYEFEYRRNYPPLINDDDMTKIMEDAAIGILGEENVVRIKKPTMGGEDFAHFQANIPGTFFILGTYNPEKGAVNPLHTSRFNIDEDILYKGAAAMASCTMKYFENQDSL